MSYIPSKKRIGTNQNSRSDLNKKWRLASDWKSLIQQLYYEQGDENWTSEVSHAPEMMVDMFSDQIFK